MRGDLVSLYVLDVVVGDVTDDGEAGGLANSSKSRLVGIELVFEYEDDHSDDDEVSENAEEYLDPE